MDREPTTSRETEDALEETSRQDIQRWPALLALLVIVIAYSQISENLGRGARFAIPGIVIIGNQRQAAE